MLSVLGLAATMLLGVLVYGAAFSCRQRRESKLPLPPGPKRWPVIGNLLDRPTTTEWLTYAEWGRRYGSGILHYDVLGHSVVVINSIEIAHELLQKRSLIYSDRPRMVMLNELIGFSWHFAFMPYGDSWKDHRKLFWQELNAAGVASYRPHLQTATQKFLRMILHTPDRFMAHLRHMTGMVILSIAYGIEVQAEDDPYVEIGEKSLHAMAEAGNSPAYLVDTIPMLRYFPEWFPGAKFQREAKEWRKSVTAMPELPFEYTKASMAKGTAPVSVTSKILGDIQGSEDGASQEVVLRSTMGAMYAGGTDTTVSALGTFLLAMVRYPSVQKRAQRTIDDVVGSNRLPDFTDINSIPLVDAILKEVHRWKPVLPMAVPHRVTSDDVYKGYHIPAGSIVIGNAWAMLYDETVYPEPHVFNPDRWLKDGQLNPDVPDPEVAFGFGRRICPGMELANASLWITIVSFLATFDITKAVDDQGREIEPSDEYSSGLLCYPLGFKCVIRPRSAEAELLVRATGLDY